MPARPGTRWTSKMQESGRRERSRGIYSIPGHRIPVRIDLDGSRSLQTTFLTSFFSGTGVENRRGRHFWQKKTPLRGTAVPNNRGLGPPGRPGRLIGGPGAQEGPKTHLIRCPKGPLGPFGALGPYWGPWGPWALLLGPLGSYWALFPLRECATA